MLARITVGVLTLAALVASLTASGAAETAIAGLAPDRRPDGAPVIAILEKDGDWYYRALAGIEKPYPNSLKFLEDQGAWYNPFLFRGMTYPYDIRNFHANQ